MNQPEFVWAPDALMQKEPAEAVELLVRYAHDHRASDLFLQANANHYAVSARRLGVLHQVFVLPRTLGMQIANLIKSHAGMDLTEKRRPTDGRWMFESGEIRVDFRVNAMDTLHGEDLALRVLLTPTHASGLEGLGFVANQLSLLRGMLRHGSGLMLVTGPTGAGKTTTLYACLEFLNDGTRKINTLEDPVEFALKGVRQSQVNPRIDLNYPELLRGALRQSPDVIMIGEIRDEETAHTAVRAANSGHLVLATLHSPIAAGAIQNLLAFGVHPFFLSTCLLGCVAQRLVRRLRPESRIAYDLGGAPNTFADVASYLETGQGHVIYGPDPDDPESEGGYDGQSGLFEILNVTRSLRRHVAESRSSAELHQAALDAGMLDFRRAALIKLAQGVTSMEEVVKAVPSEYLFQETQMKGEE